LGSWFWHYETADEVNRLSDPERQGPPVDRAPKAGGGTVAVSTDITELKHIEERLQESLARYDLAMRFE